MLQLVAQRESPDARFPDFVVTRIMTGVLFEPTRPDTPEAYTYQRKAILDSATPYTVIPYALHESGHIKVYEELGQRPYRVLSGGGEPLMQRFVEVSLRLRGPLVADGSPDYWPDQFVRVKAFLLDEGVRPTGVVLLGLDTLLAHFAVQLEEGNSILRLRGTTGRT